MRLHLKFAGALAGATRTIKNVPFINGVCNVHCGDEHAASLIKYLAIYQALPIDEADALQRKLDLEFEESKDLNRAAARAAKAESEAIELRAMVLALEAEKTNRGIVQSKSNDVRASTAEAEVKALREDVIRLERAESEADQLRVKILKLEQAAKDADGKVQDNGASSGRVDETSKGGKDQSSKPKSAAK